MSTKSPVVTVAGFDVDIVRKDIKNLHLGVYPPFGRVRVAAPPQLDDEAVRLAVVARLSWIKKQRQKLQQQPRQTEREMVDGESHYVWGRQFRLRVIEDNARHAVTFTQPGRIELHVPPGADRAVRAKRLETWYRQELRNATPKLLSKWALVIGVEEPRIGLRRMKTKWGTCVPERRFIWLNIELAHKTPRCLEYIVVHEMIHLLERNHTDRFFDLMTKFLPHWQTDREELNAAPLGHHLWER